MKKGLIALVVLGILAFILVGYYIRTNNTMVEMKGEATKQWANVESSYQRRNDLIGNLVKTVQGAADFERGTLTDVIEARSKASSVNLDLDNLTPEKIAAFEQAQAGLSSALSRLLVTVERYPELKANQNFVQLQTQLEGTENRINVERNRFNEIAGDYNIYIDKIPANIVAGIAGFDAMTLFESVEGAEQPVDVEFNFD
ncbi:LemA protein [Robiginitalea myxolifaciens]|uniref:LemA protein n=1 Tax=Robiginitalea myxolifaciens TaxID=400055 RepID=A0A1I6GD35_9FLAO|nr:LemA family protein [Robiginitalea myxolifaciens]SFR39997.1 LemA protein [Robiginitalea myxolifaciens]